YVGGLAVGRIGVCALLALLHQTQPGAAVPDAVDGAAARDGDEPGLDRAARCRVLPCSPPGVDERLLEDLLGVRGLAEHAEQKPVEPRGVTAVQLLEGALITSPDRVEHGSVLGGAGAGWG